MQDETTESYLISPRRADDAGQMQDLQRCREAIEQLAPDAVSGSRTLLKVRLPPALARQIQEQFGSSLIIERDSPLADPRLMPDIRPD